jgi:hypothetical protein
MSHVKQQRRGDAVPPAELLKKALRERICNS